MAKINSKQAEIDVAKSERDAQQKKAEQAKAARERAEASLEELHEEHQAKAAELENLKREKAKTQSDIRDAEKELQVCDTIALKLPTKAHDCVLDCTRSYSEPSCKSFGFSCEGRRC